MIVGFGPCYAGGARRTSGVGWLGATSGGAGGGSSQGDSTHPASRLPEKRRVRPPVIPTPPGRKLHRTPDLPSGRQGIQCAGLTGPTLPGPFWTNSIAKTVRDTLAASRCPAAAHRKAGPGNAPAVGALLFPKSGRLLHEQSSGWVRKQKQFGGTGHETPFGNGNG